MPGMTTQSPFQPRGAGRDRLSTKSLALGFLSIAPVASCALGLASWAVTVGRMLDSVSSLREPAGLDAGFALFAALLLVGAVTSVAAFVALLVDVFTNPEVSRDRQLVWILVLLFANVFAFPVYWYVVHWRTARLSAAT